MRLYKSKDNHYLYVFDTGGAIEAKCPEKMIQRKEGTYTIKDPKAKIHLLTDDSYLNVKIGKKTFVRAVK